MPDEKPDVASDQRPPCPDCDGRGKVLDAPANVLGGHPYWEVCPTCQGTGRLTKEA